MRLSIKIPVFIFVGCLVAAGVGSVFLAAGLASEVRDSFERRSEGLVRTLGAMGASSMAESPPNDYALQQAVDNLEEFGHGAAHGIEWLAFVDCAARIVAHSDPRRFGTVLREVPADWLRCGAAVPGSNPASAELASLAYEGSRLLVVAPVRLETRSGTVAAAFSLAEVGVHESAGRRRAFFYFAAFAALLAIGLSLLLRSAVARRLSRLTADTGALRDGDLGRRSTLTGSDEVGQLARSFNAMADKLARHAQYLEDEVRVRTRELEAANRELARLATTDALTGLLNRRRMQEILDTALEHHKRKGRTLSVVMIDLDFFKRFNDTHGHLAGDELLRTLGDRLRSRKRAADSAARLGADTPTEDGRSSPVPLGGSSGSGAPPSNADASAARYGGEEFLLILPETSKVDAVRVAERVRSTIQEGTLIPGLGEDGRVTLSAGVASYPEDGADQDSLLRAADTALYAAKHAGRNRVAAAPAAPPPGRGSSVPPGPPHGGGS
jgi:GGDEF domain-containing protein/HAMP domain-containing protein